MEIPRYITQLTRTELADILKAAKLTVGPGLAINREGDGFKVTIDQEEFKRMLWNFSHNGGFAVTYDGLQSIGLF